MFLADYHLHSDYSFDGHSSLDQICQAAIDKGLSEIAITDHMDIYSREPYTYILDCSSLYKELEECIHRYEGTLTILRGIELGQPMVNPQEGQQFLIDHPQLDFIIGSVHNMEGDVDVADYDFVKNDPAAIYDHYLDYLLNFAENYDYDVIGHITYPLRYFAAAGIFLDITPFLEKIEGLYQIIIHRGKGIELNVSGLRQDLGMTMPSEDLLKLYRQCGGEILTIGSDAHYPYHVGCGIQEGQKLAHHCGFRELTIFRRRIPDFRPL